MPKAARGGGAGNPAQADKEAAGAAVPTAPRGRRRGPGGGADKTAQADEARRRPIFVPFETDESIRFDLPVHNPFDVVATIGLGSRIRPSRRPSGGLCRRPTSAVDPRGVRPP